VVVVKNVLPEKEALEMKEGLKEYIKINPLAKGITHSSLSQSALMEISLSRCIARRI
jgi:hypothetical protein